MILVKCWQDIPTELLEINDQHMKHSCHISFPHGKKTSTSPASDITGQDFEDASIFSIAAFYAQLIWERFLVTSSDLWTQALM